MVVEVTATERDVGEVLLGGEDALEGAVSGVPPTVQAAQRRTITMKAESSLFMSE